VLIWGFYGPPPYGDDRKKQTYRSFAPMQPHRGTALS
jgi:hypothetical protein